ncbi:hypothetical protein J6590_083080 [Homalodisca vitripennis]|nr:hypothetical protein J6590_099910 [Homalodisca vitripennis]KAG8324806.1 hypothetical protein J6590_083080 [Homalodisca vitripennis]
MAVSSFILLGLLVVIPSVLSCRPGPPPHCHEWHIGINRVNPRGAVVYGHANVPIHQGSSSSSHGQVHGSRVFGGPYSGAQTVGGNLNYQHNNGVRGSVGATHMRGVGNSFSASAGGSGKHELLPFVFNGVIVTGGEKKWGWRGPSCQLEIARVLE